MKFRDFAVNCVRAVQCWLGKIVKKGNHRIQGRRFRICHFSHDPVFFVYHPLCITTSSCLFMIVNEFEVENRFQREISIYTNESVAPWNVASEQGPSGQHGTKRWKEMQDGNRTLNEKQKYSRNTHVLILSYFSIRVDSWLEDVMLPRDKHNHHLALDGPSHPHNHFNHLARL